MSLNAILVDPRDNVATVTREISAGEDVAWGDGHVIAVSAIPEGHKVAICRVAPNELLIKYGYPIGAAMGEIEAGAHVHSHCMSGGR